MNREEWLTLATKRLAERFQEKLQAEVPSDVKVSCSWPGGGSANKRIGECWPRSRSKSKVNEVFISPRLDDKVRVLGVLAHELCHAIDDCKHGHGREFGKLARGIGLEGPLTATCGGKEFNEWAQGLDLPAYPHAALEPGRGRSDRSGARVKLTCPQYGASFWVSKSGFQLLECCPFCGEGPHA